MNREFKRDLNNNYMILSDNDLKTMDDYRVRMLISNHISFILKCNVRKFDGIAKYYYEITSKHPMNRIYDKKKIGIKELNNIITSFLKVLNNSMEYLLNPNDFILDSEYIYMNIETNQVYFCYMPGYEVDISKSFNGFASYLLEKIDHDDKHAVATAYELYRQTLNDNYCLRDILNSITEDYTISDYEKTEELKQEETIRNEYVKTNEQNEEEIKVKKKKYKLKPVYLLGSIVIFVALAFLIYYVDTNRNTIKSIKFDSNLLIQIGGVVLIIFSLTAYVLYKNYQLKQEEKEDDNLIIVSEPKEPVSFSKEKKADIYKDEISFNDQNKQIFKEQKEYMDESINKDEEINRSKSINSKQRMNNKQHALRNEELLYSKASISDDNSILERNILNINQQNTQTETYGNTVLLACRSNNRRLIALKDKYSNFELIGKSFLIGKMEEHVDGVIQDELISRIHAEIRKDDGKYYLTDLNSTNGTYHNERRLEANETVEIVPDDMIRFATTEYVFR